MNPSHRVSARRLADAGWLTILPLILNFISLGSNGYIIRLLGESGYGTLVVALGLSGATTLLSNLGLRALYTKAVAGADDTTTEQLISEQLGLRLWLGLLAGVLAVSAAMLLYPDDPGIILCTSIQALGVVVWVAWTVLADVLNARERFAENTRIAFAAGLALTLTSVVAAALGGGPVAVAAAYLIGPLVNFGLLHRTLAQSGLVVRFGGASWPRYRKLLRDARALAANDVLYMLQGRAEGIWAPLLFGKSLMGVQGAGMLPSSRLEMASDGVATAYFSAMAAAHRNDDDAGVRQQATGMFTLMLVATLPMVIFLWFGAPYVALLLFPSANQVQSAELCTFIIRVGGFALPISGSSIATRYALQSVGLHSRNAKDQMLSMLLGAGVALTLAFTIGIKGLVIATLSKAVLLQSIQARTFLRRFPDLWSALPWGRLLAASTVPLLILGGGLGLADSPGMVHAAVVAAVAATGYVAAVLRGGLIEIPRTGAAIPETSEG
ncbi:MAG TPA: oligosaccharide flippase family protein [Gemmatimonadales bacterium]|nr:oligosaccharide flippase family protein [Gemmatimonadales bacterium]